MRDDEDDEGGILEGLVSKQRRLAGERRTLTTSTRLGTAIRFSGRSTWGRYRSFSCVSLMSSVNSPFPGIYADQLGLDFWRWLT